MSTYSAYNQIINNRLGNSTTVFYTQEMRLQEINNAVNDLLAKYDLPEMIKVANLSVTSGIASKPSDFFRHIKLWSVDANGIELNEYVYTMPDIFDTLASTAAYYWTEDFNIAANGRRLLFKPSTTVTLKFRYLKKATTLTSENDNGLSSEWDEAIALQAVKRLMKNSGQLEEAQFVDVEASDTMTSVYSAKQNVPGQVPRKLKSAYAKYNYLRR